MKVVSICDNLKIKISASVLFLLSGVSDGFGMESEKTKNKLKIEIAEDKKEMKRSKSGGFLTCCKTPNVFRDSGKIKNVKNEVSGNGENNGNRINEVSGNGENNGNRINDVSEKKAVENEVKKLKRSYSSVVLRSGLDISPEEEIKIEWDEKNKWKTLLYSYAKGLKSVRRRGNVFVQFNEREKFKGCVQKCDEYGILLCGETFLNDKKKFSGCSLVNYDRVMCGIIGRQYGKFFNEGVIKYKVSYRHNEIDGYGIKYYLINGNKRYLGYFKNGSMDGFGTLYYLNENIEYLGFLKEGKKMDLECRTMIMEIKDI